MHLPAPTRSPRSVPRLIAALVACALLSSPHAGAAEHRDLVLLAGQSNAVGYDALADKLPPDPRDANVLFWFRTGDPPPDAHDSTSASQWVPLGPQPKGNPLPQNAPPESIPPGGQRRQYGNFKSPAGGFGPEIGFARALQDKEQRPLAIVKAAFSGTGMRTDWNPADPGPGGACYRALCEEVRKATAAAAEKQVELRLRAFLWVQGESDSNAKDAPDYARALGAMLDQLRKDLNAPGLPAFLAINTHFGNDKNPFVPKVVEAQKNLAAASSGLARYVDTEGAETLLPSQTHFTTEGTLEVGRRFAAALLDWEKQNPQK